MPTDEYKVYHQKKRSTKDIKRDGEREEERKRERGSRVEREDEERKRESKIMMGFWRAKKYIGNRLFISEKPGTKILVFLGPVQ